MSNGNHFRDEQITWAVLLNGQFVRCLTYKTIMTGNEQWARDIELTPGFRAVKVRVTVEEVGE